MKIRRTLLTAGVFALLAMIYVPTPHQGYRLIFSQRDTSVAFFQLLLNVGFAALLGAILATIIPKLPLVGLALDHRNCLDRLVYHRGGRMAELYGSLR